MRLTRRSCLTGAGEASRTPELGSTSPDERIATRHRPDHRKASDPLRGIRLIRSGDGWRRMRSSSAAHSETRLSPVAGLPARCGIKLLTYAKRAAVDVAPSCCPGRFDLPVSRVRLPGAVERRWKAALLTRVPSCDEAGASEPRSALRVLAESGTGAHAGHAGGFSEQRPLGRTSGGCSGLYRGEYPARGPALGEL